MINKQFEESKIKELLMIEFKGWEIEINDSKILKKDDYPFIEKKLFEKKFSTKLIYRASRDGFGLKEGRERILNKKNLLHLFKVKGREKRFGAFNDICFKDKHREWEDSPNLFVISIDRK